MARLLSAADMLDPNVLLSGDIIGFQVDCLGLLSTPSSNEPIPEHEEQVSHLRVCTTHKKPTTADYRRCMFKIENDSGEYTNIVFGSTVKISHYPTEQLVIASTVEDEGFKDSKLRCVSLSSSETIPADSAVHRWIISPRYKLREEGDPVRHNDYVVLRNAQYKQLCLTSFVAKSAPLAGMSGPAASSFSDHMVGLCSVGVAHTKPGLNILLLRKIGQRNDSDHMRVGIKSVSDPGAGADEGSERSDVLSSDYVRVVHREYRGHLVVRTDDEVEIQSSVMPLGATTRKRGDRALDHTLGVFLRAFADQQPREQLDFPAAYSSQGVWQILSADVATDSVAVHGKLKFGSAVRLRHVITGQYLSVRPLAQSDTEKLKQYCSFCIPKQVTEDILLDPTAQASTRTRNRHLSADAGDLPAVLLESLTNKRRQSRGGDNPFTEGEAVAPDVIDLCVASVRADDLHSTDWTGKHRNSVHLSLKTVAGTWELRSKRSAMVGNECMWEFDKLNVDAHFSLTQEDQATNELEISVYREHAVSGRTLIGQGKHIISPTVFMCDTDETIDMTVELMEPGTTLPAGLVIVRLLANALLTKEEARLLALKAQSSTGGFGLMGRLGRLAHLTAATRDENDGIDEDGEDAENSTQADDESENQENLENRQAELLDGGVGLSAADINVTNWVVATSCAPDKYTKFNLLVVDKKSAIEDDVLSYNERFVFEHVYTRQRMKLSTLLGMESDKTWWEYNGDTPLVPDPFKEGSIIDSEVCQFEMVDKAEINDILYGSRFLQLARAATTALQLTPRSSHLYMPLFRHFHNSLQSLTLWTLGVIKSESTLCAEITAAPEAKKLSQDSSFMKSLAGKLNVASEKLLSVVNPDRIVQGVQGGLAMFGIDSERSTGAPNAGSGAGVNEHGEEGKSEADSDDDDDNNSLHDVYRPAGADNYDDTDEEEFEEDDDDNSADEGWSNAFGLQLGVLGSGGTKYRSLEETGKKFSKKRRQREASIAAQTKATTATADAAKERRLPSLAPWIGRKVPHWERKFGARSPGVTQSILAAVDETPLQKYSSAKLDEFVYKDLPTNEIMLRRQIILADNMYLDQIVHFLNVLFQLQRAAALTHDERMQEQFSEVPPLLLACSAQINKLIRACVFKNDKNALKLISVQGSFLAMISQKIQGWEPPIDAILLQTCKEDVTSGSAYGCVGSINSQNESLVGSSMYESGAVTHGADEEEEGGGGGENLEESNDAFNIEPILMDAISASDIRQVVEQMHELHLKRDPSALKIIGLLTLLCSSGRAKKYFQNLLINALAIQDHEDYSLTGDFVQSIRPCSLQTNCMLFFTQFNHRWEVKFNSPFSFPSQQSKNQEQLRYKLEREGNSLKKLFAYYNSDDNAVLDVMESFELLEDLGLGGPFLYKEIRYLESSTIWGFASWWCYRSSFYYPASSISQCQLSPVQAIAVMGEKMTADLMELEMRRTMVSEQSVAVALDPLELLNSRIPGLCLVYDDLHDQASGGLGLVEDYVRSLGQAESGGGGGELGDLQAIDLFQAKPSNSWASKARAQAKHNNRPLLNQPNLSPDVEIERQTEWLEFSAALEESYSESAWFRLSLNLLAEICKDRNAYTQRIVGSILPAECILAILEEDSVHYVEKGVLCKLLANIYVDHKLVFPTRFAPFNTATIYLGYNEDILNPAITMGKLFNAQSRTRFEGEGSEDGTELRRKLFVHLAEKISSLQLVSRSRAKVSYLSSLLSLFKLLVLKGFFQEPEFQFLESNNTPDDFIELEVNQKARVARTKTKESEDGAFTMAAVRSMLIKKLNFVQLAHKCNRDFEEISSLDDAVANEQHDTLRGKQMGKKSLSTKTAKKFRRKKKYGVFEEGVSEEIAVKRCRSRKTFDRVRDNFAFFDVLFADNSMADVVCSVLDILAYIHDIDQMLRLTKCWNYVMNAKLAMTARAYSSNMAELDVYVPRLQMDEFLSAVYDEFSCAEAVPGYVEAIFSTTLYDDHQLRRRAYELLDRQMSLVRDGQHMFEHLTLVAKGHKAFIYRMTTVYEDQMLGYVHQIASQPTPTNAYLLERLTFCVENLRALHFSTFLDRLEAPTEEDRRVWVHRTTTNLKKEAKRLNIDSKTFQPDGKPEQDCMSYLMRPIPCPTGADDFFELDLERMMMQEGEMAAMINHFNVEHQSVDLAMPESVVDCDITMPHLGMELIRMLIQITRSPAFFPWHALYEAEKFMLDQILSFLAEVAYNSQKLIDEWYPLLSELIISYFPESIGCGKMAISILRRCKGAHVGKDTFTKQIIRAIVHHNLVGTALSSSIFTAILQCDDHSAVQFASSFMLSRIQDFTSTFNFRTQPGALIGNETLRHQLHSILNPLSMCFTGRTDVPESILSILRVPLSPHFCTTYLEDDRVPLYLKTSICKIAAWLYPYQMVPIESLVLGEVRAIRKLFTVDVSIDYERCMLFSRDFLFQGVLGVVKKRLLDSRIIPVADIHAHVIAIISYVEENKSHNPSIAKIVGVKLRNFFTSKHHHKSFNGDNGGRSSPDSDNEIDSPGGFDKDLRTSLIDLSLFQCVMVLLNVIRLKHGRMSKMLNKQQRADLIFVCAASQLIMKQHPECVVNPQVGEGLRDADFQHIIERLDQIVLGMVNESVAHFTEKHISTFYETALVQAARRQFSLTAQSSAEKVLAKWNPLRAVRECFGKDELQEEKSRFQGAMKLAVVFPVDYLIQTPYFLFLKRCLDEAADFMDIGGDLLFGDWKTPVVKSRSFARKFSKFTDFELWLRGQGRYLHSLLQYLGRVKYPTDAEYNLLHLLTALLLHDIEEIRQSTVLSLNIRMMLVERETQRLRRLQLVLNNLGAQSLLTIVLGNTYNCALDSYVWLYAPLVLTFTNEVISWGNRESQNNILETISYVIEKSKPPEMSCLLGLRTLIRKCNLEVAYCSTEATAENNRLKSGYPDSEHTKILRCVKQLITFVGTFCKGDNVHAQQFFGAKTSTSKQYVNVVLELCLLTNSILTKFTSMIEYMHNAAFYERLGPLVWESKDATKRRYLAWHHPNNNILLFTQYMFTIVSMFDGLLSMCSDDTCNSMHQALNKCPEILEFAGLMQLTATSRLQGHSVVGVAAGKQLVQWNGGDPFQFYRTYAAYLSSAEIAEGDPENDQIIATLKKWSSLKHPSSLLGSVSLKKCDFLKVFGVSHGFFEDSARKMEEKCLAMVLAYFEVVPMNQALEMASKFNDGMLLQNMNCTFQKIFSGGISATDKYAPSAVSYTSLIESIGLHFNETRELLEEWEETSMLRGKDPKKIYGVVEIIGKNDRLQRLYFPVPTFVSRFWPYPEVQKMKDEIVMTVNRQSPEEKLADYLQQMLRITTIMKRQERLRGFLSFPVHAFFGGKTTSNSLYLPNQRMLALLVSLVLNLYYCYFTSLSDPFHPHSGSYVRYWVDWDFKSSMLMIVKAVHLGLNASLTLSRLLNSEITDELFLSYSSDSFVLNALLKALVSPVAAALLLYDTFWPICMLIFSFLAFYMDKYWLYVPCLFDVAFQLTFMNFLYAAVAQNGSKIWYTLVLAFLCLYFYSVIATLYFSQQYDLDGHSGCENIINCFKLHLDYGLYNVPNWDNDGYISPSLPFPFVYGTLLARILGTMYNVSYVILINLVLQSIISGLIIDTFSQLREENEAVLQDIADKCFVCSISRDEFEQAGIPFKKHIREEHNMWHYVWFKIYLDSKDPLTYSSSENHSADNITDTQSFLKLMPIKKSVSLQQKGEHEADEKLDEKLDALLLVISQMNISQAKLTKSVAMLRRANARIELKMNQKAEPPNPLLPTAD